MSTKKLQIKPRIAIVGIGRWGKNLIYEFSKIADIKYCLHFGNKDNAQWMCQNYPRITIAKSYLEILKDRDVGAVVIATPIKTHYGLAQRALSFGKHVFVEKPIADSFERAKLLVDQAKKGKKVLFVGYTFIHHPVIKKLQDKLKKDLPIYASLEWHKYGTFTESLVQNLMTHEISIGHLLFGVPKKIKIEKSSGTITACDSIFAECQSRIPFNIRIDRTANFKHKTVTVVSKKNTWLWEENNLWKFNRQKNTTALVFQSKKMPLEAECLAFVDAITNKKKPVTDGRFGLEIIKSLSSLKNL